MRPSSAPARRPACTDAAPAEEPTASHETPRDVSELLRTELDFTWRTLRRHGLSADEAEDVSQQVLLVVARKLPELEPGRERSFLYGTARRLAANFRRGKRRRRETLRPSPADDQPSEGPNQEELLGARQRRARLHALLATLPAPLRRVVELSEIEQLPAREVAELEGIPLGTVASRLRRARQLLRDRVLQERRDGLVERRQP